MSECTHDCSTCGESCKEKASLREKPHELSKINKVIGIVSGKGGVGKTLVTSLLAVLTARKDKFVGILDADITGPSIPKLFGIKGTADGDESGIYPRTTKTNIRLISANLLLENETDPIIWRGAMISNIVKQFWTDVIWGDIDYMFIDMPPGTGDVPLTVFQSIKVDGIIVVTSPQDLVSMIVEKAVNMAKIMNIPVLGIVENMSYLLCPDCGKRISVFGESKLEEVAARHELKVLGQIPIDASIAKACDEGRIEAVCTNSLDAAVEEILKLK